MSSSTPTLLAHATRDLAKFAAETRHDDIPSEVIDRIKLSFIDGLDASKFEGSEARSIVLRPGTPKEKKLSGQAYLANYGLPQFSFHATTAYAILRHNGLAIGKKDYMGAY